MTVSLKEHMLEIAVNLAIGSAVVSTLLKVIL